MPYLKAGVESWQDAFEEAGFENAIIAREAPTPDEDPEFSPEDARYSVIRWLPSSVENAMGPHINDPRTGEILESDIQFHHNVMNLVRDWYFVQAGPLDPLARDLPLPDELMGQLLQYVAAHEVGHTLGFQHNMKASSMYPVDKVRDPDWVASMSHTPTLMDYSRFNYVAQPEDGIDPADFIPKIGPYDKWATMWGYKPIPEAATADDERAALDEWARAQDDTPWYRFTTNGSRGADPGELTEAVGDANAVEATTLGLKNLERVADLLLAATTEPGKPYDDLEEVYGRLVGQWATEMNHVAAVVGGFESQQKHAGQEGVRFVTIGRDRQAGAMAFLNAHAFETPAFLIDPEILRRIEATGVLGRIESAQGRILGSLLSSDRMTRLIEQEALDGGAVYAPTVFLADLRHGIWRELDQGSVEVDAYRRNLQHLYLSTMDQKLNGPRPVTNDERAFVRGELRSLDAALGVAVTRATGRATRLHLEDARDQIARALDPKFATASRSSSTAACSTIRRIRAPCSTAGSTTRSQLRKRCGAAGEMRSCPTRQSRPRPEAGGAEPPSARRANVSIIICFHAYAVSWRSHDSHGVDTPDGGARRLHRNHRVGRLRRGRPHRGHLASGPGEREIVRPRWTLREDRRDGLLRGRPGQSCQPHHRRYRPRPAERGRQGGVPLELLPHQAEGRDAR